MSGIRWRDCLPFAVVRRIIDVDMSGLLNSRGRCAMDDSDRLRSLVQNDRHLIGDDLGRRRSAISGHRGFGRSSLSLDHLLVYELFLSV